MKYLNTKIFIWLLIGLSVILYLIYLMLFPIENKILINYLKPITTIVTLDALILLIFRKWFWKTKILYSWLVPFPNLNGTWKGLLKSNWTDPKTGKKPSPIPIILTIKQSFTTISCIMRTEEMTSYSFSSSFVIDKDNQILRLVYSYDSIPKQVIKERSPQHLGTINLDIIYSKKQKELIGDYWTARETTGSVELVFWKKEQLNKYPIEIGKHPVSQNRNK